MSVDPKTDESKVFVVVEQEKMGQFAECLMRAQVRKLKFGSSAANFYKN